VSAVRCRVTMSRLFVAVALVFAGACGSSTRGSVTARAAPAAAPVPAEDALAIRVQEALMAAPELDAASITVHVQGDTVHLIGRVRSSRDLEEARRIAEGVPGVTHAYAHELRLG
jgi:osmotically-inducible protein OsmY